jgi:hypothetical protein
MILFLSLLLMATSITLFVIVHIAKKQDKAALSASFGI